MSKQSDIKRLLDKIVSQKGLGKWISESQVDNLATSLSNLSSASRQEIKNKIYSFNVIIKESVDFSDTDYLIDQIVNIINNG